MAQKSYQRHLVKNALRDISKMTEKIDMDEFIRTVSIKLGDNYHSGHHVTKVIPKGQKHLNRSRK